MPDLIHAPWTPEQVTALNRFQQQGGIHPFTCGGDHTPGSPALVAHADGWRCPEPYGEPCDFRQDWAHAFMADPATWPKSSFGERPGPALQEVAAAAATELDKTRRYLRPVRAYEPGEVHLATYEWLPTFEAWATGPGLCGRSMRQGPLPEDAAVTCARCLEWKPSYERWLAPGYRKEDDDLNILRERAETAERQVKQARALIAKWEEAASGREGAVVRVDVAAGILKATLDGFNDLLAEVEGR